jgi:hypothetical protein
MVHLKRQQLIVVLIIALIFILIQCDNTSFSGTVDCSKCYSPKPDSVNLILNLTINEVYTEVPVLIFKGDIGSGEFIDTIFCRKSPELFWVKAEETYSAKAIYNSADRTVFVVDGVKQKLNDINTAADCPNECWTISNSSLDLRLVY